MTRYGLFNFSSYEEFLYYELKIKLYFYFWIILLTLQRHKKKMYIKIYGRLRFRHVLVYSSRASVLGSRFMGKHISHDLAPQLLYK